MSSAQIVLIGANAEQGLHQTLDGFLARLEGKTVVLIDDVYVTGSSEKVMFQAVSGSGARDIAFLYVARMDSAVALRDPKVEDRINHRWVKTLDDLAAILTPGKYRINLRNCKFVLDAPIDDVRRFLGGLDTTVLSDLHETILANSYYLERRFAETCAAIETELVIRGSAPEGTVRLGSGSPSEFAIPDGRHPNAIDHG
ncbi:MAG: phosphoribosyltransferase family protein [Candidatus Uhrbacteria bacterium]